jgi:hypothetical protein
VRPQTITAVCSYPYTLHHCIKSWCLYQLTEISRFAHPAENVKEHLVTPGQWYHDRAMAQVLYFPLPGVDVAKSTIVLAVEEILVKHLGVSRHSWTQVVFQYATWLRPMQGKGFVEQQAGACNVCDHYVPVPSEGCGINDDYVLTPGNVVVSNSHDLEFVNCTFRHLGVRLPSSRVTFPFFVI